MSTLISTQHNNCKACETKISAKSTSVVVNTPAGDHLFHKKCQRKLYEINAHHISGPNSLVGRIRINASATISSLKKKIADTYNFSLNRVSLTYNDASIEDGHFDSKTFSFVSNTIQKAGLENGAWIYAFEKNQANPSECSQARCIRLKIRG